jgi:hypothetical protein
MWLGEDVKDFDIYFTNYETTLAVAHYYTKEFNETHKGVEAYVQVGTGDGIKSYFNGEPVTEFGSKSARAKRSNKVLPEGRIRIFIKSQGVAGEVPTDEPFEDVFDKEELPLETKDEKPQYRPVFLSSNAITLSDRFQLIIRFYGDAEEIHKNFDYAHATNYFTTSDKQLHLRMEAMEALMNKDLKYVGSKYPLCSIIRSRKFIQRGYKINAGEYLKIMFQLSQLDLTDVNVLEEQLVGVDSAYFEALISQIRRDQEKDPNFTLDNNYVVALIDKIF